MCDEDPFHDEYESLPPASKSSTHMMAGAAAGMAEHCLMYPVDSIKTRMQSVDPHKSMKYRNIVQAFREITQTEGIFRPVRGINAVAVGAAPAHAMYFACYEKMKKTLCQSNLATPNFISYGLAGCCATVLHDAVMNPAEVVKQRMQMFGSSYTSCSQCFLSVWRSEGARAFYRSYGTQLTMNIPFQSLHFVFYELSQEMWNPSRGYSPLSHVLSGGVAGAVAAAATTPLDVCKTLLNTQEKCAITKHHAIEGMLEAASAVYRFQGFPGFLAGLQARVIYQMPSTAIAWSVYEFFKYYITRTRQQQQVSVDAGSSMSSGVAAAVTGSALVSAALASSATATTTASSRHMSAVSYAQHPHTDTDYHD